MQHVVVVNTGFRASTWSFDGSVLCVDVHRGVGADGRGLWLVPLSAVPNQGQAHIGADEV